MEEIKPEVETMSLTKEKYAELALLYELGLNLVHTIILNLAKVWAFYNDRGIYENIITRLKEYDSTLGKCKRKEVPTTLESVKSNIRDIAGLRIITSTISDIFRIRDAIINQPGLKYN